MTTLGPVSRNRASRFGVPVDSFNPAKYYIISLDYESRPPSIDELILLRAYRDYIIGRVYNETYARALLTMPAPAIGGHNTTTFKKIGRDAWVYRKLTWTEGPLYVPVDDDYRLAGIPLPALLDHIESVGRSKGIRSFSQAYLAWRSLRPRVFPALVSPAV